MDDFDLDEFMSEAFGENVNDDSEGDTYYEGDDDEFDDSDLEVPELDEDGEVDDLLDSIETGDVGDDFDDKEEDDDLAELEKEYHITAAGDDAVDTGLEPDDIDDEFGDLDDACLSDPDFGEGGGCCDEMGNPLAPLDPELDARGDQMLAALVTPDFAEAMLTVEEFDDWIESGDAMEAVAEGYLEEGYVQEAAGSELDFYEDGDIFNEGVFAPEGKKYKMTKTARLRQLYQISLQIEARLHKDPGYPRMQKIFAIRRQIKARWHRQYGALAMRRAKRYLKNIMNSKSSGIKKVASRLIGKK